MSSFEKCKVVDALAGAGKTYKLTNRYLELIAMGADPNSILATTFSKKAAGEIRDRIIETIATAVLDEEKRDELSRCVPQLDHSQEGCSAMLRTILSNLHRLEIGTIDSFFIRTARVFGDEMGFSPEWKILDELQEGSVLHEGVVNLLRTNDLEKISNSIQQASTSTTVPVTETIRKIAKVAYDIIRNAGTSPWQWGEVAETLNPPQLEKIISDAQLVQSDKSGQLNTFRKDLARAEESDWREFLTTGLPVGILNGSYTYSSQDIDPKLSAALQPLIEHASAVILNRLLEKNAGIVTLMSSFNDAWSAVKHDRGLYRFDDVTHYLGRCTELTDLQELAYRLDSSIDHLLIDEFQDTSLPQWEILKLLVDEIVDAPSDRSLFFVGDPKQSLYGFRGGEPHLLRSLPKLLGVESEVLEVSWRCSPTVLDLVNQVFLGVTTANLLLDHSEEGIESWSNSFEIHKSAREDQFGVAQIHTTKSDITRKPSLEFTIEKVSEIVRSIHTECPHASIGVLVRKNTKQQIQRIVHSLRSHSTQPVIASEHRGNPLTDSPQVTTILSALLLADHPGHTSALFHVSTSLLGKKFNLQPSTNRVDADKLSTELRSRLSKEGYANVVYDLAVPLFQEASSRDQLRLWQLIELAETYSPDETLRPSDFVEFVKKKKVPDPTSSQVQVMTVHASKGLGFDAVVLCDLDQSLWESSDLLMEYDQICEPPVRVSAKENEQFSPFISGLQPMWETCKSNQVEGALSLLYVAMTRAKHALHLVIPPRPANPESKKPTPSKAKTFDRLLRQAIGLDEFLKEDSVVWESSLNQTDWMNTIKPTQATQRATKIDQIQFAESVGGKRAIATTSPSSLQGGGKTNIASRFSKKTNIALDRGTVVHGWFEEILWLSETPPSIEALVATAPKLEASRLTSNTVEAAAESFLNAIQNEHIQTLLKEPTEDVSVFREQEFILRIDKDTSLGGELMKENTDINGTIDRLVVYRDANGNPIRAEVIDWKTDRFEASTTLPQLVEEYAPQLASYRLATAKLLNIEVDEVKALLAFAMEGCVEDVSDAATVDCPATTPMKTCES